MREYAARRGWTIALQVSGAARREAREKVLEAARRREIDLVLVWRLDRWGRSVADLLATFQELEHLGVGFVSLTETLDPTTPAGRAMAGPRARPHKPPKSGNSIAPASASRKSPAACGSAGHRCAAFWQLIPPRISPEHLRERPSATVVRVSLTIRTDCGSLHALKVPERAYWLFPSAREVQPLQPRPENDCMLFRRSVGAATAVFSLAAIAIAQSGATVTRTFLVGLGSTETAQIAVVNLANAPSSGPAASCTGSIAFFNAAGTAIGTATAFILGTGQVASARLPFISAGASGVRALIRGVVTFTRTSGADLPCIPAATLDTFDSSTGATNHRYAGEEAISPNM